MSLSNSPLSYPDAYDALDRAMANTVGIRIRCPSITAAHYLRSRIHQARAINRRENARTYPNGHPLHSGSIYDKLMVTIDIAEGSCALLIKKIASFDHIIEDLGESAPQIEHRAEPPTLQIEHQPIEDLGAVEVVDGPKLRRV